MEIGKKCNKDKENVGKRKKVNKKINERNATN